MERRIAIFSVAQRERIPVPARLPPGESEVSERRVAGNPTSFHASEEIGMAGGGTKKRRTAHGRRKERTNEPTNGSTRRGVGSALGSAPAPTRPRRTELRFLRGRERGARASGPRGVLDSVVSNPHSQRPRAVRRNRGARLVSSAFDRSPSYLARLKSPRLISRNCAVVL